ncbi:hypothetical protein AVEN_167237-1 [Araneus ventricosus]|uniref:Uncharacterized protein n=1 Tax=Araneus ventricosus TaxID=182803 RepID=A0A4Y2NAJ6_ARAVE|nr:hypothetical protein AVEN_167237-1 [Araneus ventricosus]
MPTPVPWPAALDYAVEDPWREQPDRGGPTDSRLGLNPDYVPPIGVSGRNLIHTPKRHRKRCMGDPLYLGSRCLVVRSRIRHRKAPGSKPIVYADPPHATPYVGDRTTPRWRRKLGEGGSSSAPSSDCR